MRVASTEFRLLFEGKSLPIEAWISNPFTNRSFKIKKSEKSANLPSTLNQPLIPKPKDQIVMWSGTKVISSDQVFRMPVRILPGTRIKLKKGVNVVFRRKVQFLGTESSPIILEGVKKDIVWGAIAILGPDASGSVMQHTHLRVEVAVRWMELGSLVCCQSITLPNPTLALGFQIIKSTTICFTACTAMTFRYSKCV